MMMPKTFSGRPPPTNGFKKGHKRGPKKLGRPLGSTKKTDERLLAYREMIRRAEREVITPDVVKRGLLCLIDMFDDKEVDPTNRRLAIEFIVERGGGKNRVMVDLNVDQTLTIEAKERLAARLSGFVVGHSIAAEPGDGVIEGTVVPPEPALALPSPVGERPGESSDGGGEEVPPLR